MLSLLSLKMLKSGTLSTRSNRSKLYLGKLLLSEVSRTLSSTPVKTKATRTLVMLKDWKPGHAYQLLQTLDVNVPIDFSLLLDKFFSEDNMNSIKSTEEFKIALNDRVPYPWKDADVKVIGKYWERFKKYGFPEDLLSGDRSCLNMMLLRDNEYLPDMKIDSLAAAENIMHLLQKHSDVYSDCEKSNQFYKVCEFYKTEIQNSKKVKDREYAPFHLVEYAKKMISDKKTSAYLVNATLSALNINFENDSVFLWECE